MEGFSEKVTSLLNSRSSQAGKSFLNRGNYAPSFLAPFATVIMQLCVDPLSPHLDGSPQEIREQMGLGHCGTCSVGLAPGTHGVLGQNLLDVPSVEAQR